MNEFVEELKTLLIDNLRSINNLKNEIDKTKIEKNDLVKEISLKIIDILDSIESIEEWIEQNESLKINEVKKVVNRYSIIQKKLINILHSHGIQKITFPENKLIVGFCEVVDTEPDINKKNDEIITVIRSGYIRGKELIRPAQVIVVKN